MIAAMIAAYEGTFGAVGVRDPEYPCDAFDGAGYDGSGNCRSDGHYMCKECSRLSPDAPRFTNDRDGRRDRLRLYFAHVSQRPAKGER